MAGGDCDYRCDRDHNGWIDFYLDLRGSAGSIDARFQAVEKVTAMADFKFASTSGVTIAHNIGSTNYSVNITPSQNTGGDLGDVYVDKASNSFTNYNSGGFTGTGRYQITH